MKASIKQTVTGWMVTVFALSFGLILVLLPLHAFLSTWLGTTIGPLLVWKSWKEILLLALLPLLVFYGWLRPEVIKALWQRRINQLIIAYVLLHVVLSIFTTAPKPVVIAGLLMNLRFFAIFILAQLIVEGKLQWVEKIKAWLPHWLFYTALGLAVLAIAQVTVVPHDFLSQFGYDKDKTIAPYSVVDQNPNALRAFATMRGPNTLGEFLVLPLTLAVYGLMRQRYRWLSLVTVVLGGVALVATGSRSAWLGFGLSALVLLVGLLPRGKLKPVLIWSGVSLIVAGTSLLWLATTQPAVRLAIFHSRTDRPSLFTGSTQKHWQAIVDNGLDALAHPLGQGPGAAGPASFYDPAGARISENYFIQIAQEIGVIGLLLFIIINVLVAADLYRQKYWVSRVLLASFVGLTFINLLLHGWADDPTAMTWWGIAGLYYKGKQ